MASRHRLRERALQMIFQWEASGDSPEQVASVYWGGLAVEPDQPPLAEDRFANSLLFGVAAHTASLDALITKYASNWKIERMAAVDRNILRLAVYEMEQGETAPPVVITEALELGRRYSGEKSAGFLNGVLDAIRKHLEAGGDSEAVEPTPAEPNSTE